MPRRAKPSVIAFVGGPLDGERRERTGTGRIPMYRNENGEPVPTHSPDLLPLIKAGTVYVQEITGGPHAQRLDIKPSVGRVYVHSSRIAATGPVANPQHARLKHARRRTP